MNSKRQIIKAMAVIRRPRDGALLVSESPDPLFQRPLGGHVEFGEYALETVHREFREELAQELTDVRLLGVLENNPDRRVLWRPADALSPPLYPAGLSELIAMPPMA